MPFFFGPRPPHRSVRIARLDQDPVEVEEDGANDATRH
jgi:hypothetical protein